MMTLVRGVDVTGATPKGRWQFGNTQSIRLSGEVAIHREHIVNTIHAHGESGNQESGNYRLDILQFCASI